MRQQEPKEKTTRKWSVTNLLLIFFQTQKQGHSLKVAVAALKHENASTF